MNQEPIKPTGAEINVLSVGPIEPALIAVAEAFQKQGGAAVRLTFANTPAIREHMKAGTIADVVIAPPAAIDDFTRDGKVLGEERTYAGRVGVGVMVRQGAPVPDISSADAVRRAVLDAEAVIFNRSSSGLAAEAVLKKLGVFDQITAKTSRHNGGQRMMERMGSGKGREIGFGAIFEILLFRSKGVQLVGPLPPDIQHYTTYMAVPMTAAPNPGDAKTFMRYLASQEARTLFVDHGIE